MAGIGFDSEIVHSIDSQIKKYLGKIIFALKGLQHFIFLKNKKMKVNIDGKIIKADWVLVTNSKYYAGPHSITKKTNIFDNKVIAYIFEDLSRIKILYYLWLILSKGDLVETSKNERHAIRAIKDSEFLVFTQGPRGGKEYEKDTFRLSKPLIK